MSFSKSYVAIIDVGHGNSTILHDQSESIIIDCGSSSSIIDFLEKEGIKKIDSVFLSHADADHIGGLVGLISSDGIQVGKVYVNSDSIKTTKSWDDLIFTLSNKSVKGETLLYSSISTTSGEFKCGSIILKVVGPTPYFATKSPGGLNRKGQRLTSNSISASFHIKWENNIIAYLAGDIDQIALDDLIEHNINIEAPLLVFPHHGGKSGDSDVVSFTEQLCDLTKAKTVVFSIGRNKFDNPRPEVVKAVRDKILNVRIACTQLSKHCSTVLPSISPTHLLNIFSKGRNRKECCSGTFIIKLGQNSVQQLPDSKSHQSFISSAASSAMCN